MLVSLSVNSSSGSSPSGPRSAAKRKVPSVECVAIACPGPAPAIREVRGRGLMLAVELDRAAGGARPYCEALKARGVLAKDTHEHSIRIAPPLVIIEDQVDWALEQFEAVLTKRG